MNDMGHDGAVAVIDSGASSIAFSLFRAGEEKAAVRGQAESIHGAARLTARDAANVPLVDEGWDAPAGGGHREAALDRIAAFLRKARGGGTLAAVGHRVVHGGMLYDRPVRIDASVVQALEQLVPLAPLHQPYNLAPIKRLLERSPEMPQVACFDTAFHRTQPEVAQLLGLPRAMHAEGVRRFGFDGLSYESVAAQLPAIDPIAARGRTVILHLANDASLCALFEGRSVATTMGFTRLDGLLMATRCGALDAGVPLYLMQARGMPVKAVEDLLYNKSGLLGVSGVSGDMRALLESKVPAAALAIDLYVYRIRRELGALASVLGGLDAIVFTGGNGENGARIRERVCRDARWLGVQLDVNANNANAKLISVPTSRVKAWRLASDAHAVIARHARALVERTPLREAEHA